jgi:hypothetical protein
MWPYRISGFEQCENSSRKWCSTVHRLWKPACSPSTACSTTFLYASCSLWRLHGRATGIS